jgi:hypothetical protein
LYCDAAVHTLKCCGDWIKLKNRAHPAIGRAMLIALSERYGGKRAIAA